MGLFIPSRRGILGTIPNPINPGTTGLIDWWSQNTNGVGQHGGNNMTEFNSPTHPPSVVGNGLHCTLADSQYQAIVTNADVETGDIDFTWATWINMDNKDLIQMFIAKDNSLAGPANVREYYMDYHAGEDRFQFTVFKPSNVAVVINADNFGSPSISTWDYVIAWHDAAADILNIQVNNGIVDSIATGGSLEVSGDAFLGFGRREVASVLHMDAGLDETLLYKRILKADERSWLWNEGNGRSYGELN